MVPHELSCDILARAKIDLNAHYSTRVAPLSTQGLGRAGLLQKVDHHICIPKMETANREQLHKYRRQVSNINTDQGTEIGLNDSPLMDAQSVNEFPPGSDDTYMFPESLGTPGHIHLLSNDLQTAIESLPMF